MKEFRIVNINTGKTKIEKFTTEFEKELEKISYLLGEKEKVKYTVNIINNKNDLYIGMVVHNGAPVAGFFFSMNKAIKEFSKNNKMLDKKAKDLIKLYAVDENILLYREYPGRNFDEQFLIDYCKFIFLRTIYNNQAKNVLN